ncbi:hypothetical protein [uncultured Paraglaciecola sp.]|uniref:hypothetical protein n=1 Tax=uncultured Paraglaciecola sp. TaxID=1765024 RepID=UPI002601F097|nr:hypothetical protein [uncultured Paraglaciecola sp.]
MKKLSDLSREEIKSLRIDLSLDSNISDDEVVDDGYGWGLLSSRSESGEVIERGDIVLVTEIDPRITKHLPPDEVSSLESMIGEELIVEHINFDESLLVEKVWNDGGEMIYGHSFAVFAGQYKFVSKQS